MVFAVEASALFGEVFGTEADGWFTSSEMGWPE